MTGIDDDLQRENSELLQFLYACPVGLIQADMAGSVSMLNPVAMQLLQVLGSGSPSLNLFAALEGCAPELRHLVTSFAGPHGQICQGHRLHVGRVPGPRSDLPRVLACTIVKLDAIRFMATLEDVSERVDQERRLKQADALVASFLEGAEDFAVLALDPDGIIQTMGSTARQQTGFEDGDLIGSHIEVIDSPDRASAATSLSEELDLARRDGWHLTEGWCATRDGRRYRCQRLVSVRGETEAADRRVAGYTVVLRPVSEARASAEQLRRRLTTDHLTGACNRAHFFDIAEQELRRCARRGKSIGLICVDVDHFKSVNDTHGHAIGDLVLQAVARVCMAAMRPSDTFARIGGEEFTALLPAADAAMMAEIAETMRTAVAALSVKVGDFDLRATVSLGYAIHAASDGSIADLMRQADQALYGAKRSGRNRVVAFTAASAAA